MLPDIAAVYKIVNIINNKCYVGASKNIRKRKNNHWSNLKYNRHRSKSLNKEWNEYGKDNFKFEILEITKNLTEREQYWCDLLKANNPLYGYNLRIVVDSNKGMPISEEQKKIIGPKISKKLKGKLPKNWTEMQKGRLKPIIEYENGVESAKYNSCKEAGKILGVNYKLINAVLRGNAKAIISVASCKNKTWKYANAELVKIVNND